MILTPTLLTSLDLCLFGLDDEVLEFLQVKTKATNVAEAERLSSVSETVSHVRSRDELLPRYEPHSGLISVLGTSTVPILVILCFKHLKSVHRTGDLQRQIVREPADEAREEAEGDVLGVGAACTSVLNAPQVPVDELIDAGLVRRGPHDDLGRRGLAVDPHLNGPRLLELGRDRGVGADADSRDGQIDLSRDVACPRADDMFKKIDSVLWEVIGIGALRQGDGVLRHRPEVHAPVGPICEEQVQRPPRRAQVIARAKLRSATLEGFLDRFVEVEVEHRRPGGVGVDARRGGGQHSHRSVLSGLWGDCGTDSRRLPNGKPINGVICRGYCGSVVLFFSECKSGVCY